MPLPRAASVWSAFGAARRDVAHVFQRWSASSLPASGPTSRRSSASSRLAGREVWARRAVALDRIELAARCGCSTRRRSTTSRCRSGPGAPIDGDTITSAFVEVYEALHGEGSGHPEGGIAITSFIVRARGLTDAPAMSTPPDAVSPEWASRQVYWYETGGFVDTPVLRLHRGRGPGSPRGSAADRAARHRRRRPPGPERPVRRAGKPGDRSLMAPKTSSSVAIGSLSDPIAG